MTEAINLWDFQVETVDDVAMLMRHGIMSIMLSAPTGSGKTTMAAKFLQGCYERNQAGIFINDRRTLVDQTAAVLTRYGIPHGVDMAGASYGRYERIKVASAQTVEARGWWPDVKLAIFDEAHNVRQSAAEFIAAHPDVFVDWVVGYPCHQGPR